MKDNYKLSEHFSFYEMTATNHRKYLQSNRNVPLSLLDRGIYLCRNLLEPIRQFYNSPIIINSGYRSPALNRAIRGSKVSQHCRFEAADFTVIGVSCKDVYNYVKECSGLHYGQLILEYGQWIHISLGVPYRKASYCMQNLIVV